MAIGLVNKLYMGEEPVNSQPKTNEQQILSVAKTLGPVYSDGLSNTVNTINGATSRVYALLVAINSFIISQSLPSLQGEEGVNATVIRWGIFLCVVAVLVGFIQYVYDDSHLRKTARLLGAVSAHTNLLGAGLITEEHKSGMLEGIKSLANLGEGTRIPLLTQCIFTFLGAVLILSEFMF